MWAGTAINDTSQVVTAAYIFGEDAGNTAIEEKQTRNLFMAPVILLASLAYYRRGVAGTSWRKVDWAKAFPHFVLGFVGMAMLRTLGVFSETTIGILKQTSSVLIVMAIAGVGLSTSFASMKKLGSKPFYVGLRASILMGRVSYTPLRLIRYPRGAVAERHEERQKGHTSV